MSDRDQWAKWLLSYGPEKFYDSFIRSAQNAESRCVNCNSLIYLDIAEGGGIPDWRTQNGDYGCGESPDTNDSGTGGHIPFTIEDWRIDRE